MKSKRIGNPLSALKHKNFRYYWLGMCVSTTGTWMQNTAQPWLAYRLTDSPFLLSLVSALQFTPMLLFSLFAGVIIDRLPKKKLLIFTQSASLVVTLVLAILAWTGKVQYWHILITATALGIVNTLDMPVRQAFIVELTGKEDLMNAIALNSAVFNMSRIIGPAIAGIVMGVFGVSACFLANSISFGAVLFSLLFIKPMAVEKPPIKEENIFKNIVDGLKYIYRNDLLFFTLFILAVVGTFAPNFNVLVPVYAIQILHQQETGFGLLMSFLGIGSFLGAMLIAALSSAGPKKFVLYFVPLLIGISLVGTGYMSTFLTNGLFLAITGFFFVAYSSSSNSALQLNSSNEYRGRVMSVYTLTFAGSTPLGNLFAGAVSERFDARVGFISCGVIILILMIPIYLLKKMGYKKEAENKP
ncbi:Enterobactin exporter EntS [bioreactor metagenome]|uniref:Enterobactin exporter EntS n=1 Tax=bioreactor metagenome TaxID=1076179 RepID=A0A644WI47_9ZZZZ